MCKRKEATLGNSVQPKKTKVNIFYVDITLTTVEDFLLYVELSPNKTV